MKHITSVKEIIEACKSHYNKCTNENKEKLKQCYKEIYKYSLIN